MLYRKAYDKLKMWKQQTRRVALCIQGARQIVMCSETLC